MVHTFRLNYGGMQFNDCNNSSQDYQYLRADFMWNVLGNLYKDDVHTLARWSVIPYVGVGMLHNKVNAHKPFAISYGIQGQSLPTHCCYGRDRQHDHHAGF